MTKVSKSLAMTRNSCLTEVSGTCFSPEPCCYVLPCLSTQSWAQNTCQALTLLWVHSWGSQPQGCSWSGCPPSLMPLWHSATACHWWYWWGCGTLHIGHLKATTPLPVSQPGPLKHQPFKLNAPKSLHFPCQPHSWPAVHPRLQPRITPAGFYCDGFLVSKGKRHWKGLHREPCGTMSCLTQQLWFSGVRNPAVSFEVVVAVSTVILCAAEHVLAAGCPQIPVLTSLMRRYWRWCSPALSVWPEINCILSHQIDQQQQNKIFNDKVGDKVRLAVVRLQIEQQQNKLKQAQQQRLPCCRACWALPELSPGAGAGPVLQPLTKCNTSTSKKCRITVRVLPLVVWTKASEEGQCLHQRLPYLFIPSYSFSFLSFHLHTAQL